MTNLTGKGPMGQKKPKPDKSPKRMKLISDKRAAEKHPLRDNVKGKMCTLRLPGCRNDTAYTVLAHYRRFGWAGAGQKPLDVLGCFACDRCHDKQERYHPDATDADLLRAMGETLAIQLRDGVLRVSCS